MSAAGERCRAMQPVAWSNVPVVSFATCCRRLSITDDGGVETLAVEPRCPVAHPEPPGGEPAHALGIDQVLLAQDARGESRLVVARQDGHPRLYDHGPAVEFGRHEMHARAVLAI